MDSDLFQFWLSLSPNRATVEQNSKILAAHLDILRSNPSVACSGDRF
jgi:hypothetical protein